MTASLAPATIKDLALADGATIKSLVAGLTEAAKPKRTIPDAVIAKPVQISAAAEAATNGLVAAIRAFALPDSRRELTEVERKELGALVQQVKDVKKLVATVEEQLRIVAFNDFDVVAEREGKVNEDTPRDKDGFYLTNAEGPGYAREVSSPTLGTDTELLRAEVAAGHLTHTDFLGVTRPVRVVDEDRFLKVLGRKPHLLPVLRKAITATRRGSVSFKAK